MNFDITTFIAPVVSIVSIFVSNYLGRTMNMHNHKYANAEKTYSTFYIPLIKWLAPTNQDAMSYFWKISMIRLGPTKQPDWLKAHLTRNLEFALPSVVSKYQDYMVKTGGAEFFYNPEGFRENYRQNAIEASKLFDLIITESLKEASTLSEKLGYPNTAKPILEIFEKGIENQDIHSRYLPEIYQKGLPRMFEGTEPPYY